MAARGPDYFDDQLGAELTNATAQGQLLGQPVGEIDSDDDGLDASSSSGQA